ncbi:hypothetical protein [Marinobacter salarius]|uniref:hypothetical protein n=1 Tax=Marinobacter salarius TaxID=1420917 RepID=UPI003BA9D934
MKLMNWLSKDDDRKKKTDMKARVVFAARGRATADALLDNESSYRVDENGNVELNFDDSEVQRVLKKRLDSLRDYDLTEDSASA